MKKDLTLGLSIFLLVLGAALFAFGLAPWVIRHTKIYASPRSDGKPG